MTYTKVFFKDLQIGDLFHDGIRKAQRACDVDKWMVRTKETKTSGRVVEVHGSYATRNIGGMAKFSPNTTVWKQVN
jgi:hypothetical protein